jgi:probable nitrogen fixation protein
MSAPAAALPLEPLQRPFLKGLVSLVRAEDRYGAWERKADADLIAPFVVTREARRAIPIVGDPSPEVLARVEQFYKAVCSRIEQRTGLMASPVMALNHEGFGRLVLTVGKLVAFGKTLRDVHRFGFETLEALEAEGEKVAEQAVQTIDTFPEAARA